MERKYSEGRNRNIGAEKKATEKISEAEISMVLDTFMYMDYKEATEKSSLSRIVEELADHPDYGQGGIHYGEYTVLKEAVQAEEIGSLQISHQSINMGYDSGTAACVFSTPDEKSIYVVYRGTGDGEWLDNGLGMTEVSTIQQEKALAYFEEVTKDLQIDPAQRLVVTGHSKGGNKAQFVTMETEYADLIDACYSVDGQGFSQAAINNWKEVYGKEEFGIRCGKIYGICGENDYVNVLGNSIILKEQISYIQTPVKKENFAGYHDIKYMFAAWEYDPESGEYKNVFHGRKNGEVDEKGKLGEYAEVLSGKIMELEPEKRDGCAAVIMQLMEMTRGTKKGINGEKLTLSDVADFLAYGIPSVAASLMKGQCGQELLYALVKEDSFGDVLAGNVNLEADYENLFRLIAEQEEILKKIDADREEVIRLAECIPGYLKGGSGIYHQIKLAANRLYQCEERLKKLERQKEIIAKTYENWERQALEEVRNCC